MKSCCGICKHHRKWCDTDYTCNNPDSDDYGLETDYEHVCEEYEAHD